MNKVALITGSAKNIGASIVRKLASDNFDIVINYNNSLEDAIKLKEEIMNNYKIKAIIIKCDISKELEVKEMVDKIIGEFGKIDVLVNNASVCFDSLFHDKTEEIFNKTLSVNVTGTFLVSKYVGEIMYNNGSGKIINITSTNGIDTYYPMSIDYDASKAAIISLTHNLAFQFAPYVCVNAIAPGFIENDLDSEADEEFINQELSKIMLHRFGKMEEVANLVSFLASDESNYINNEVIRLDGGFYG